MTGFSVVIPAYNEAPRIGRAIQSVLDQSHPVDEIIVVDDGSQDNTHEIAESFGSIVTCVRQKNQGLAAARNAGIRNTKCEWIALLDADDEWLPCHIRNAWLNIQEHPDIQWYCCAYERRSEAGDFLSRHTVEEKYLRSGVIENYFSTDEKASFTSCSSIVIKKSVFDEAGLFNVDINHYGEDLDMWFRIALRYPSIGYTNEVGAIYRVRKGSITSIKQTNIPRYLRRIAISKASANDMPLKVKKQSDILVRKWVISATKESIRQRDVESLMEIKREYFSLLPVRWQIAIQLFKNPPILQLLGSAIQIRDLLKNRNR